MIDKLDVNGKIVLDSNGQRVQEEKEFDKFKFGGMIMKKMIYFTPAIIALLLYTVLGFISSFGTINPMVWVWIAIMFRSAVVMLKNKWYGCIGGFIVGCVLIYMSTQYTGQLINIERPCGIILCAYYLMAILAKW